jgi:hypothetical protein
MSTLRGETPGTFWIWRGEKLCALFGFGKGETHVNGYQISIVIGNTTDWDQSFNSSADDNILNVVT